MCTLHNERFKDRAIAPSPRSHTRQPHPLTPKMKAKIR